MRLYLENLCGKGETASRTRELGENFEATDCCCRIMPAASSETLNSKGAKDKKINRKVKAIYKKKSCRAMLPQPIVQNGATLKTNRCW